MVAIEGKFLHVIEARMTEGPGRGFVDNDGVSQPRMATLEFESRPSPPAPVAPLLPLALALAAGIVADRFLEGPRTAQWATVGLVAAALALLARNRRRISASSRSWGRPRRSAGPGIIGAGRTWPRRT